MSNEPHTLEPQGHSRLRTLGLVILGLVAGVGGTLLLVSVLHRPGVASHEAGKQLYQCPMHLQIIEDHPGNCPICGMKLVLIPNSGTQPSGSQGKGKIVLYRSPMNPSITSPRLMKDEMGMDYVPVYESDLQGEGPMVENHAVVTIDLERQQLIGLTLAKVVAGPVCGEVRATAKLVVDETRVRKINVKVEGFVEKLFVDFVGKPVRVGQPLFSLYSPDFVSAQQEYLLALKTQQSLAAGSLAASGEGLLEASRQRLRLWDVPEVALERLDRTGDVQKTLILRSPIAGVVTAKNVVEGARIGPGDSPLEITDLSRVWAQADIYETELGRVRVGLPATLTLTAFPGRTFTGRVAFVDPVLDPQTRTAKVRVEFANPKGDLRPELFGEVLLVGPSHKGMLVPLDAVIDTGTQKVAFIALGDGRFEPREVTTGIQVGDLVEVFSGLKVGDEVVTRANFLVDSESRFRAALAQIGPPRKVKEATDEHR